MTSTDKLTRSTRDALTVITFTGEFDLDDADHLRAVLVSAITDDPRMVCDVSPATFFDSVSLGVLVLAAKTAKQAGGWLRLAGPQRSTRRILRLTALDQVLPVYATVDEAILSGRDAAGPPADGEKTRTG